MLILTCLPTYLPTYVLSHPRSTETIRLIMDGGRMGQRMRAQAHLPVHTAPVLCRPSSSSSSMVLYVHRNRKPIMDGGRMGQTMRAQAHSLFTQLLSELCPSPIYLSACIHTRIYIYVYIYTYAQSRVMVSLTPRECAAYIFRFGLHLLGH